MEKTYNSITDLNFDNFMNQSDDIIINDSTKPLRIEFYRDCGLKRIYITDLTNAQKRSSTCIQYQFTILDSFLIADFFKLFHALDFETMNDNNMIKDFYNRELKASEVFVSNKLYKLTNWNNNKLPKKWNKAALIKAYYNGLITGVYRNYRYTDDYAHDAATKFGEGDYPIDTFISDMIRYGSYNVWLNESKTKETKGKYIIIPLGNEKGKYTLNEFVIPSKLV